MRMILASVLAACGMAVAPVAPGPAWALPGDCPPFCDRIPDSAWIAPTAIPLSGQYRWPDLAGLAVTAPAPRFKFEEVCASLPMANDARDYAVAARAVVSHAIGQWQLQAQVVHWRGERWRSGPLAESVFDVAVGRLRACQATAPLQSPSITTGELDRLAAVISGPVIVHQYLLADPGSGTVVELALWSTTPPLVAWPSVPDAQVLDAMAAPLCTAYIGSCR
nr:ATPase [Mycobacterium sp. QGD 101]